METNERELNESSECATLELREWLEDPSQKDKDWEL